jgi:putative transposase
MINPFYTFFIEASQRLLNPWIGGSRQVLALLGAGGQRKPTPAVIDPAPGGRIPLSERQRRVLEALVRRSSAPQRLVKRAQIILMLAAGKTFNQVARALGVLRQAVYKWANRWWTQARQLAEVEAQERSDQALSNRLAERLLDAYRLGKPATFSPEQIVKLIAVAGEQPQDSGRPITRWSSRELAAEVVKGGIVKPIARSTVSRLLKEAKIKPHLSRYWLNAQPEDEAAFDAQVRVVCALYRQATQLHKQGIHLVSTNEKTGIQALQHKYPPKPVRAGQVARLEHEYNRHGTLCLIATLEVATGRMVAPSVGPHRGRLSGPQQANCCPGAPRPLAVHCRQPQHPSIGFLGRMGRTPLWYRGGPRPQGQPRYPQVHGKPGRLFSRSEPPGPLCLYP